MIQTDCFVRDESLDRTPALRRSAVHYIPSTANEHLGRHNQVRKLQFLAYIRRKLPPYYVALKGDGALTQHSEMFLNVLSFCRTSLHYACAHNHPDVVLLLLENNSSVNIRDDEGCTPLIKVAIGHLLWDEMDQRLSLFGFCGCNKTLTKNKSGKEMVIWFVFTCHSSFSRGTRAGAQIRNQRDEINERSWENSAFL